MGRYCTASAAEAVADLLQRFPYSIVQPEKPDDGPQLQWLQMLKVAVQTRQIRHIERHSPVYVRRILYRPTPGPGATPIFDDGCHELSHSPLVIVP